MPAVNKVILIGNLSRDVQVKYTSGGTAIAELGLAINTKYKSSDGQTKEEVTFVDCTAWGRTAEIAGQYLQKGSPVYIEGRLKLDRWDDKTTGQKRSKLGVTVETIQFLSGGNRGGQGGGQQGGQGNSQGGQGQQNRQSNQGGYAGGEQSSSTDYGGYSGGGDDEVPF